VKEAKQQPDFSHAFSIDYGENELLQSF